MSKKDLQSNEEVYMEWYLKELLEEGYIESYNKIDTPYKLADTVKHKKESQRKTPNGYVTKIVEATLLQDCNYTPDFRVIWTNKAFGIFVTSLLDIYKGEPFICDSGLERESIIEVKPKYNQNNMTRVFTTNQKVTYSVYGIYVNMVVPEELFKNTFTPDRFLITNKSMKPRAIYGLIRNLVEYENFYKSI